MTMTTVVPTFTPPVPATATVYLGWCHDCDLDADEACLATQTRASLDGEIAVCDMHAAMHDDLARDELLGDLDLADLDDEGDLLDVAIAVGLLDDLGVAA